MADLFNVTIHARDPRLLAVFWSGVFGYPVVQDDGGDLILTDPEGNELCLGQRPST